VAGPKKRLSIFNHFSHVKKETEEKKDKEPETGVGAEPETGTKPIDTPVASTSAAEKIEKTPTSSPPKTKFFTTIFDRKEKPKAEKVRSL
jgi:hypothetical protein